MKKILCALAIGTGLLGCGTEPSDPTKLEIKSPGDITLAIGDTSELWKVSKTALDATGRTVTEAYLNFTLVSSDPEVAKVIRNQQVTALKAGSAVLTAKDDRSPLVSENSATVTVSAGSP